MFEPFFSHFWPAKHSSLRSLPCRHPPTYMCQLTNQESGFCLKIQYSQRISTQFVRMDVCDETDHSQMFEYQNGRVTNHIGSDLCASVDMKRLKNDETAPWVFSKCYGTVFGQFDTSDGMTRARAVLLAYGNIVSRQ